MQAKVVFIILGLLMAASIGVSFTIGDLKSSNSPFSKEQCNGAASGLSQSGIGGGLSGTLSGLCTRFLK